MKKYIIIAILSIIPTFASANIGFSLPSPQLEFPQIGISVTPDTGNYIFQYDSNEEIINYGLEPSANLYTADTGIGIYTFIEYDTNIGSLIGNNSPTPTEVREDIGYVGETTFEWVNTLPSTIYSTTTANSQIIGTITPISDIFTTNLPLILGILGALIGLGFIIGLAKKEVGEELTGEMLTDYDLRNRRWESKNHKTNF